MTVTEAIDSALAAIAHRSIVPTSEVMDLLLDIRNAQLAAEKLVTA